MIPKKTTKMIVKDGSGNLVQLLPEIETASTIDASSDVPVSNAALASALEDIEDSLPASALLDVMEEEPTALNTTELNDEALIVWMEPPIPSWSITINTELVEDGEKTGQIPFCLYGVENASLSVNWGDGNTIAYSSEDAVENECILHEYASPGIYTIEIFSNDFDSLYIWGSLSGEEGDPYVYYTTLTSVNSMLPKLAGVHIFLQNEEWVEELPDSFRGCFQHCESLASIPNGLFSNNPDAVSFQHCFESCTSLQSIPADMFSGCTSAENFQNCFEECSSIQSIPAGLFSDCVNADNFEWCFMLCSSIQSIPSGLFDSNTAATNFYGCFLYCTSIQSIPERLFINNTAVTGFGNCFSDCSALGDFTLHIGSSLVSHCDEFVTNKSGTTRTVYVPSNSTTQTSFNNVASSLGLTIIGE